jgi:hypothetical protein
MATKKKSIPPKTSKKISKPAPVLIDHFVSRKVADKMILDGEAAGLLRPMQFSAESIMEILKQKGAAYVRIYAVLNAKGQQTYLLTGGTENHEIVYVTRKKKKTGKVLAAKTTEETGAMNIAQVCDPVKQAYTQAP